MKHKIWIGYDPREHEAALVCRASIIKRASMLLDRSDVQFLNDRDLRQAGLFTRPYRVTSGGQYVDIRDGKPFSTMFSHSRFLVPALASGTCDWALFCDCDFLFTHPINHLFDLADPRYALMCVKHDHTVAQGRKKMDGVSQASYPRKNWSSLMLFNMNHAANRSLVVPAKWKKSKGCAKAPYLANYESGANLHRMCWLDDDQIGALPEAWNWLVDTSPTTDIPGGAMPGVYNGNGAPHGIHFTEGGPWLKGYEHVPWAALWQKERQYAEVHGLLR